MNYSLIAYRINGALQNFSHNTQISFANDSVKLNIRNPENRTKSSGVQATIMAFQFKSGRYIDS